MPEDIHFQDQDKKRQDQICRASEGQRKKCRNLKAGRFWEVTAVGVKTMQEIQQGLSRSLKLFIKNLNNLIHIENHVNHICFLQQKAQNAITIKKNS